MKAKLLNRLKNKTTVTGIVSLGYVGLPLMLRYVEVGCKVIGFDIDADKTSALMDGDDYIEHVFIEVIDKAVANDFEVAHDFSYAGEVDALSLFMPIPLLKKYCDQISVLSSTRQHC